jgi:hypothetical protein
MARQIDHAKVMAKLFEVAESDLEFARVLLARIAKRHPSSLRFSDLVKQSGAISVSGQVGFCFEVADQVIIPNAGEDEGTVTIEALMSVLNATTDLDTRELAMWSALSVSGYARSLNSEFLVLKCLKSDRPTIRAKATEVLLKRRRQITPSDLIAWAVNPPIYVRAMLIELAGVILLDASDRASLEAALHSSDFEVRSLAENMLDRLTTEEKILAFMTATFPK